MDFDDLDAQNGDDLDERARLLKEQDLEWQEFVQKRDAAERRKQEAAERHAAAEAEAADWSLQHQELERLRENEMRRKRQEDERYFRQKQGLFSPPYGGASAHAQQEEVQEEDDEDEIYPVGSEDMEDEVAEEQGDEEQRYFQELEEEEEEVAEVEYWQDHRVAIAETFPEEEEEEGTYTRRCASEGCNFAITGIEENYCCTKCRLYPGHHGPRCLRKLAPEKKVEFWTDHRAEKAPKARRRVVEQADEEEEAQNMQRRDEPANDDPYADFCKKMLGKTQALIEDDKKIIARKQRSVIRDEFPTLKDGIAAEVAVEAEEERVEESLLDEHGDAKAPALEKILDRLAIEDQEEKEYEEIAPLLPDIKHERPDLALVLYAPPVDESLLPPSVLVFKEKYPDLPLNKLIDKDNVEAMALAPEAESAEFYMEEVDAMHSVLMEREKEWIRQNKVDEAKRLKKQSFREGRRPKLSDAPKNKKIAVPSSPGDLGATPLGFTPGTSSSASSSVPPAAAPSQSSQGPEDFVPPPRFGDMSFELAPPRVGRLAKAPGQRGSGSSASASAAAATAALDVGTRPRPAVAARTLDPGVPEAAAAAPESATEALVEDEAQAESRKEREAQRWAIEQKAQMDLMRERRKRRDEIQKRAVLGQQRSKQGEAEEREPARALAKAPLPQPPSMKIGRPPPSGDPPGPSSKDMD
mmetsp:Transcript_44347/g.96506  ORF Transcript_44347/g.96506 Transcript_44347/m.96506 type:complete len:696 (+) Transcript_44347:111-2198(+)